MDTPQSLPNKITVILTKDHFTKSSGYYSNSNCALAVALKDHFKNPPQISVGGSYVRIGKGDGEFFDISDKVASQSGIVSDGSFISHAYDVINSGADIEPIVVDLFKRKRNLGLKVN